MVVSSRTVAALGLGLTGLILLVGPSLGQQNDGAVRKTTGQSTAPAAAVAPAIGTIDMTEVFKGYERVKVNGEEFKGAVLARKNELMKVMTEMQQESEQMAKMRPGSEEFKRRENKITELKAKSEAGREQAEREFALREAEMLATLYKEIQSMVTRVAKHRGLNYVLRVSNEPVVGTDPNSAMRAIERTVVYADSRSDITKDVISYLNVEYKNARSAGSPAAPAAPATAVRPSGN